jgi:hypothetical protein
LLPDISLSVNYVHSPFPFLLSCSPIRCHQAKIVSIVLLCPRIILWQIFRRPVIPISRGLISRGVGHSEHVVEYSPINLGMISLRKICESRFRKSARAGPLPDPVADLSKTGHTKIEGLSSKTQWYRTSLTRHGGQSYNLRVISLRKICQSPSEQPARLQDSQSSFLQPTIPLTHISPTRPYIVHAPSTGSRLSPHIIHTPPASSRGLSLDDTGARDAAPVPVIWRARVGSGAAASMVIGDRPWCIVGVATDVVARLFLWGCDKTHRAVVSMSRGGVSCV